MKKWPTPFLILLAWLVMAGQAFADERILDFHSSINVQQDATLLVTEVIEVRSEGDQIRRGIFRDFPTRYKDAEGRNYNIDFDVIEVMRGRQPEPYRENRDAYHRGERVYIGDPDVYLDPGVYTYTITYRVNRELAFLEDYDELYWNVTGNEWAFPIDRVTAVVNLPIGTTDKLEFVKIWTGPYGSTEAEGQYRVDPQGRLIIQATRPLDVGEGLTFAVAWPKGIIQEPPSYQRLYWLIRDNLGILWTLLLGFGTVAYYYVVWYKIGRDPAKGVIIPLYEPPDNLSPAKMRYLMSMNADRTAFTAALINLAVHGAVTIEEQKGLLGLGRDYVLIPGPKPSGLSSEEAAIYDGLLTSGPVRMDKENADAIRFAISNLEHHLEAHNVGNRFFSTNFLWAIPGFFLSFFLLQSVALNLLSDSFITPVVLILLGITMVVFNIGYIHLLRAPTVSGRRLMDRIEGFKRFLSVTERDAMNFRNPPNITPEVFEKYLPYALALEVENQWAERFAAEMKRLGLNEEDYDFRWYHGHGRFSSRSFTSDLSKGISSSIATATAVESTAGGFSGGGGFSSGGGGFSGGGGGGGGGGGW